MPAVDQHHEAVVRALQKVGWFVLQEQYSISIADEDDNIRRLFIDLAVQSEQGTVILIEVKALDTSPVHQFMQLLGQYLVYQTALNYLDISMPLYVALPISDYNTMILHPLAQAVIRDTLSKPIPFVLYDPVAEEIVQWIPKP